MTVVVAVTSVISLSLIGDCRSGCDFRDLTEPHCDCRTATSVISLSGDCRSGPTSVISLSLIGDCRSGCDFRDLTEPHW